MTLKQTREDIATVTAASLGIDCFAGWRGNLEPNTARVVSHSESFVDMDSDSGTYLDGAFTFAVVVIVNALDVEAAEDAIDGHIEALCFGATKLGGQPLANGGTCPAVHTIAEPARIDAGNNLLGVIARLRPIPRTF